MLKKTGPHTFFRQLLNLARYRDRLNELTRDRDRTAGERLEECGFRYDPAAPLVCQGTGRPVPGLLFPGNAPGGNKRAGGYSDSVGQEQKMVLEEPDEDLLRELVSLLSPPREEAGELRYGGSSSWGGMSWLDQKASLLARKRRQALGSGEKDLCRYDLRFRRWEPEERDQDRALLVALLDRSASMSPGEQRLAGQFLDWLVRVLQRRYQRLETVYVSHDYTAAEVPPAEFFVTKGTGGTRFSAAYRLAWQVAAGRFAAVNCPKYVVHCTDGENLPTDGEETLLWLGKLLDCCRVVACVEMGADGRGHPGSRAWQPLAHPGFVAVHLGTEGELPAALKTLLGRC